MRPGDIAILRSHAGYGTAFRQMYGDTGPRHMAVNVPDGDVVMYISRDQDLSEFRMQPMVRIRWRDEIISIDERFLEPMQDTTAVV